LTETNSMNQSACWEPTNSSDGQKFAAFYVNQMFITVLTTAHGLLLTLAKWIQSIVLVYHYFDVHFNIPTYVRSSRMAASFRSPHQNLFTPPYLRQPSPLPCHSFLFDYSGICWGSSSLCSLLHSAGTSSVLDPHIFLNTLFPVMPHTLFVRDQALRPHGTFSWKFIIFVADGRCFP